MCVYNVVATEGESEEDARKSALEYAHAKNVYVCVCARAYACVVCVFFHVRVCARVCGCLSVCVCERACVCVCMCVCDMVATEGESEENACKSAL